MTSHAPDAFVTDLAIKEGRRAAKRWLARENPTAEDQREIIAQAGARIEAVLRQCGHGATVISDARLTMCEVFQREAAR